MTLAVDGKTDIDTCTHTPSGMMSPISGMISPNISLKCSLLSVAVSGLCLPHGACGL